MSGTNKTIVFIVGLGSPASLYTDYLNDLKKQLSPSKLFVLEWWNQDDFGMSTLQSYIGNSEVMLIGHSAGGVIALQALARWPKLVKKIIMLDSHFLRTQSALPTVSRMLDIMLSKDNSTIMNRVKSAYAPIIENDFQFNQALKFAIEWVNTSFDQVCNMLNTMPTHAALYVGFTNSKYQILSAKEQKALLTLWKKFSIEAKFIPMSHFDLIDEKNSTSINLLIGEWINMHISCR